MFLYTFVILSCQVQDDNKVTLKHILRSHKSPVSFVTWSPDDTMLLTCGNMEVLKLWDVETGTCKHTFSNESFTVSSCAWFPDSKRLVCGSSDPKKGIYMWDCEGNEIKAWKGMRMPKVLDLAVTPDGENLISIFTDKEIRILNVTTNAELVITEEHSITSLSVSGDSKFLIVNLNSQEIHMWDITRKLTKPHTYKGHVQQKYVIRSCFGGLNSMFIASGSEDSKVLALPYHKASWRILVYHIFSRKPKNKNLEIYLKKMNRCTYGTVEVLTQLRSCLAT